MAELSAQGDGKPAWVEVDMTGKPIEEVIEYQVGKQGDRLEYRRWHSSTGKLLTYMYREAEGGGGAGSGTVRTTFIHE